MIGIGVKDWELRNTTPEGSFCLSNQIGAIYAACWEHEKLWVLMTLRPHKREPSSDRNIWPSCTSGYAGACFLMLTFYGHVQYACSDERLIILLWMMCSLQQQNTGKDKGAVIAPNSTIPDLGFIGRFK